MAYNTTPDNAFWQFACDVYQSPRLSQTLLFLQDHYQANVMILLFMRWFDEQQRILSITDIQHSISSIDALDKHCIQPCRALRRHIKSYQSNADSYDLVKQLELRLEQQAADLLFACQDQFLFMDETFSSKYNQKHYLLSVIGIPSADFAEIDL